MAAAGGRTEKLATTAWRPTRRGRWIIAAVAALAVGLLTFGVVSEARSGHRAGAEDPGVRVFSDEGPGLSYGVRDESGWHCTFSRSDFACNGGTGHAKGIGSARRGEFDVTAQFVPGDGLVVVYDSATWTCDLHEDAGRYRCLLR